MDLSRGHLEQHVHVKLTLLIFTFSHQGATEDFTYTSITLCILYIAVKSHGTSTKPHKLQITIDHIIVDLTSWYQIHDDYTPCQRHIIARRIRPFQLCIKYRAFVKGRVYLFGSLWFMNSVRQYFCLYWAIFHWETERRKLGKNSSSPSRYCYYIAGRCPTIIRVSRMPPALANYLGISPIKGITVLKIVFWGRLIPDFRTFS